MFGSLFKNKTNANSEPIEYSIVPCACDGNNEHCDLIVKLREYQSLRTEIKNQIDYLNKGNRESLSYFIEFLKKLEKNNFKMNSMNSWITSDHNMLILGHTINEYSAADIWRITEELKTYRNKEEIICEKQRTLKAVENDISNIKAKLGIE